MKKYDIRFWACDRSHSGVEILVHVPNLQHSGIPEYVKEKAEAVDLFLKTALFLNLIFFSQRIVRFRSAAKYASVASSRLRSRKKVDPYFLQ